jgi:small-conductance mechanosensitive channel
VKELWDYAVLLTVRAYVRSEDYWKALYALQRAVKDAFDKAGILIPVSRQAPIVRTEPSEPGNTAKAPAD